MIFRTNRLTLGHKLLISSVHLTSSAPTLVFLRPVSIARTPPSFNPDTASFVGERCAANSLARARFSSNDWGPKAFSSSVSLSETSSSIIEPESRRSSHVQSLNVERKTGQRKVNMKEDWRSLHIRGSDPHSDFWWYYLLTERAKFA